MWRAGRWKSPRAHGLRAGRNAEPSGDATAATSASERNPSPSGGGGSARASRNSAGERKSRRGALQSESRLGSDLGEDGEDRVERPRSRPVERNQCRFYSRALDPEGIINSVRGCAAGNRRRTTDNDRRGAISGLRATNGTQSPRLGVGKRPHGAPKTLKRTSRAAHPPPQSTAERDADPAHAPANPSGAAGERSTPRGVEPTSVRAFRSPRHGQLLVGRVGEAALMRTTSVGRVGWVAATGGATSVATHAAVAPGRPFDSTSVGSTTDGVTSVAPDGPAGESSRCFGSEPGSECAATTFGWAPSGDAFGRRRSKETLTNAGAVVLRSHRPSRVLTSVNA